MSKGRVCRWFAGVGMLAAVALGSGLAGAQVYKCVGHDGRTSYGDQPCRGAATGSQLAIEPNVIDTAGDRLLRELAEMTPEQIRQQRPAPECDRAVQALERARRALPLDAEATRSAYQAVIERCGLLGAERSPAPGRRPAPDERRGNKVDGAAPGDEAHARGNGSPPRVVPQPLPPGATDRGNR